jgi:hypothetical protein
MARHAPPEFAAHADESVEALEQRVRRLEHAVAALQDTQLMEDRVVERVARRVEPAYAAPPLASAAGLIVDAGRMLLPKTVEAVADGEPPAADGEAPAAAPSKAPWLLLEALAEFRAVVRMLADYRYRMSWTGRLAIPVALGAAVLSWFLFAGRFVFVGDLLDKAVDVAVVVVIYKVLLREVQRHRDLIARAYRRYR